ncbi:uncharacterized protein LOC126785907 [Argentina anserina]|uniref:uncharacterized protein LOC126785907 n=1 Tax=Argentina anserina TaxID=57926 RepID=UPI0021766688|nr:uncharacterized protein LOC126785907 [Potentilla anserina]
MASELIKSYRNEAEIYQGEAVCKQKFNELWEEFCLPKGVLRSDIEEMGHHRPSGFVWLKQKKKKEHKFKSIDKTIVYGPELTMFVEKGKIKKLTGCDNKEMCFRISVSEICFKDPALEKLSFKTSTGLSGTYLASEFQDEDDENKKSKH